MLEEWTSPDITEPVNDAEIVTKEMVDIPVESDEFVEGYAGAKSAVSDAGKSQNMVRYKGRYITPEVYGIIQKEKDIQKRRYSFIQKQKQQKEQQTTNSSKVVPIDDSSVKSEDKQFGKTHNSINHNPKFQGQADMYEKGKYKPYEQTTKAYGFGGERNSI